MGNSLVLRESALVEALNLKAAIEFNMKNVDQAKEVRPSITSRGQRGARTRYRCSLLCQDLESVVALLPGSSAASPTGISSPGHSKANPNLVSPLPPKDLCLAKDMCPWSPHAGSEGSAPPPGGGDRRHHAPQPGSGALRRRLVAVPPQDQLPSSEPALPP